MTKLRETKKICDTLKGLDNVVECEGRCPSLTPTIYTDRKTLSLILTEKFDKNALIDQCYSGLVTIQNARRCISYTSLSKCDEKNKYHAYECSYGCSDGIGRFVTGKVKGKTPLSQILQPRVLKYAGCRKIYDDVDMVNAHPTLIKQLFEYHNLPIGDLDQIINDRETILKKVMEEEGCDRDEAKAQVLKGFYKAVKYEKQIDVILSIYPEFLEKAVEVKGADYWNLKGCAFAYVIQTLERLCLMAMYEYFTNKGFTVGALIHDGLHLEKSRKKLDLNAVSKYVKTITGFTLAITKKPFKIPSDASNKVRFQLLDDEQKIDTEHINSRFLTKLNADDKNGIELADSIIEGINIVKSYTGSGKTCMLKRAVDRFELPIVSIVSRRSLAEMHAKEFKLNRYDMVKKNEHGLNEVYQIDSIELVNINGDFILFMDEVASLIGHTLNNMEKMSKLRLSHAMKLYDIINSDHCKVVIGTDANTNQGTIDFLRTINKKHTMKLFVNDYTCPRKTPVVMFENVARIIDEIEQKVSKGEKCFVSSNANKKFKAYVVDQIKKRCKLAEDDFLLYSGDEGETEILTNTWKNYKVVFCTPTILYGIDYNKNDYHVFGIHFNQNTIDGMGINQQLNRVRKPLSINLHTFDVKSYAYETYDLFVENCNEAFDFGKKKMNNDKEKYDEMEKAMTELYRYESYRQSHHYNIRHHVLDLLRSKGYNKISINREYSKPVNVDEAKFRKGKRKEWMKMWKNKTDYPFEKKIDDINNKLRAFGLDDAMNVYKFIKGSADTVEGMIEEWEKIFEKVFVDDTVFESLMAFSQITNEKFVAFTEEYILTDYDIRAKVYDSMKTKCQILRMMRKKLGIKGSLAQNGDEEYKHVTKDNHDDEIEFDDEKFVNIFKKAFNYRSKKAFPTTRGAIVQLYTSKLRSVLGDVVNRAKKSNKKANGVKYTINKWNMDLVTVFQKLIDFNNKRLGIVRTAKKNKKKPKEIKKKAKKNLFKKVIIINM